MSPCHFSPVSPSPHVSQCQHLAYPPYLALDDVIYERPLKSKHKTPETVAITRGKLEKMFNYSLFHIKVEAISLLLKVI